MYNVPYFLEIFYFAPAVRRRHEEKKEALIFVSNNEPGAWIGIWP